MESGPVSSETVDVIVLVDVLIVAMTSPGKFRPLRTARTSLPSGDRPMDWTTPVPFEGWLVEMVVTTVVGAQADDRDPSPAARIGDVEVARAAATARATGSLPTETVVGVAEHRVVVVALHVVALKYSILLLAPSAT